MTSNKVIHYIWYQGVDKIPDKFRVNIDSMYEYNKSTWTIRIWNSKDLYKLACRYSQRLKNIFYKLPHMHQRIDLGRYLILYYYGGLSMDTDVYPLKPLDTLDIWEQPKVIVGEINMNKLETIVLTKTLSCPAVNNAIIYSRETRHVVLETILDHMIKVCIDAKSMVDTNDILWTTGPTVFSQILCESVLRDQVLILPFEIFEPVTAVLNVDGRTEHSVLVHDHEQSWVKQNKVLDTVLKVYVYCRPHINMYTVIIFFAILIAIIVWIKKCIFKN